MSRRVAAIDAPAGAPISLDADGIPARVRFADDAAPVIEGRVAFRRTVADGYECWSQRLLDPGPGEWAGWHHSEGPGWQPEANRTTVYVTFAVDVDPYVQIEQAIAARQRGIAHRASRDGGRDALTRLLPRLPRRGVRVADVRGVGDGRWRPERVAEVVEEARRG